MASKTQAQRFIKFINQQIDILKGERTTVLEAVDEAINQVQSEVDAWVKGDLVNQTTFAQMNNRITQVISLFMVKSDEISGLEIKENKNDFIHSSMATSNDSIIPKTSYTKEDVQERKMFSREETLNTSGVDTAYVTTSQFSTLEEVVLSLKKTTERSQEKQEKVNKNMEKLTNTNIKSQKKVQERLLLFEKRSKEISSSVDELFETVTNIDDKLNRLEEENKSVNISMNELNKEISLIGTCINDSLMSIQDLSKSVESTNQHYNEMSNKMNKLEISMNLMSSQCTEQLENMGLLTKHKTDEMIGLVCQLLASRLTPLEKLNETLKKKVNSSKTPSQEDGLVNRVATLADRVKEIEIQYCFPTVGFIASTLMKVTNALCHINTFSSVRVNYGSHFDQMTGIFTAPLNGLYLISIRTRDVMISESLCVSCFRKGNNQLHENDDDINQICDCSGNQSISLCSEMAEGDEMYLQSIMFKTNTPVFTSIYFSCFMIK